MRLSPGGWGRSFSAKTAFLHVAPGPTRPGPGSLFPRRKSDQNAAGDTPDPALAQSAGIRFDTAQPLNHLFASGVLVIGAVGISLRLTALGLIGVSCHAKQKNGSTPLTGRQPKPEAQPATDQMPKSRNSVAAQYLLCWRPIGQKRGSSPKGAGAFLVTFCAYKKSPGSGAGSPGSHVPKWARRRQAGCKSEKEKFRGYFL